MIIDDDIIKNHGLVVGAVYAVILTNPTITHIGIADYCHISVSSVKRALDVLQDNNYIEIVTNKPLPNTYKIIQNHNEITVKTYGEYNHVRLTQVEKQQLLDKYGESVINDYVVRVDTYIELHPHHEMRNFRSHYAIINKWIMQDNPNKHNPKSEEEIPQDNPLLKWIIRGEKG